MKRYIDADELIEFFDSYPDHIEFDVEDIKSIINEQDTADVRENVRGEWIDCGIHGDWAWEQDGHGNSWHIWKCSKCEYKTEHRNNYCPNCGAEMRGDNNGKRNDS